MAPLDQQATFFRTALYLGLVTGRDVVAWADGLLAVGSDPPPAVVHLAAVPEHDITGLRLALLRLGPEREPWPVTQGVLGLVARQLEDGRRSLHDTRTVLHQLRQGVAVPADVADTLKAFEVEGMRDDPVGLDSRLREWLRRFSGADAPFTPARP